MNALDRIGSEIRTLGCTSEFVESDGFPGGKAVVLDYPVPVGRYGGQTFRLGIAFQEDAYPEYPPHFVCVADLPVASLPVHSSFRHDNAGWSVFSVPSSDFRDSLPSSDKNMKTYLYRHLTRFWNQI